MWPNDSDSRSMKISLFFAKSYTQETAIWKIHSIISVKKILIKIDVWLMNCEKEKRTHVSHFNFTHSENFKHLKSSSQKKGFEWMKNTQADHFSHSQYLNYEIYWQLERTGKLTEKS